MEDDSPYDIAIAHACEPVRVSDEYLSRAICTVLSLHQSPAAKISVALVDDAHIARLNETHLGHRGPTDVLTFDLADADKKESAASMPAEIDGEIVVSVETARREATARGHALDAELALYMVHGTLHLLGYRDDTDERATRMHEMENEVLTSLGAGPVYGSVRRHT